MTGAEPLVIPAAEGFLAPAVADAIFTDALMGPALFDAVGGGLAGAGLGYGIGDAAAAFDMLPAFGAAEAATSATSLPFGLTTSDLLQGGLRAGQFLMENDAYGDAADRTSSLTRQMMTDQRGYTDRATGEVNKLAQNFDPKKYAADYDAAAANKTETLSDALAAAAPDAPSTGNVGDFSDRYERVGAQTGQRENERIQNIARLIGRMGAHGDVAQTNALRGLESQINLGNIGADRNAALRAGQIAMAGIEPSGGQLTAAQLLGFGADAIAAKTKPKKKTMMM